MKGIKAKLAKRTRRAANRKARIARIIAARVKREAARRRRRAMLRAASYQGAY